MNIKNWLFADIKGQIVTWQLPNLPIILWMTTFIAAQLTDGNLSDSLFKIGYIFLGWWAWLELKSGVNRFRRLMGLGVMAYIFVQVFNITLGA